MPSLTANSSLIIVNRTIITVNKIIINNELHSKRTTNPNFHFVHMANKVNKRLPIFFFILLGQFQIFQICTQFILNSLIKHVITSKNNNKECANKKWNVGNKAEGRISKQRWQENKGRQIFRKRNISYSLIRTRKW